MEQHAILRNLPAMLLSCWQTKERKHSYYTDQQSWV